jgi:hypothetical protein
MTTWWRTGLPGAIGNQSPESPGEVSLLMVAGDPGAHFACAARAAARATYGLARVAANWALHKRSLAERRADAVLSPWTRSLRNPAIFS